MRLHSRDNPSIEQADNNQRTGSTALKMYCCLHLVSSSEPGLMYSGRSCFGCGGDGLLTAFSYLSFADGCVLVASFVLWRSV